MSANLEDLEKQNEKKEMIEQLTKDKFAEQKYRWVIVILTGLCFFVNGLANNAVIPIAHKISVIYNLPSTYLNAPITASFLIYSLSNFPANFVIDHKGLRFSFLIGSGLYSLGIFFFTLINKGYFFLLIGAILVSLGQPFIVNCPAKVATYWFLNKNRTFATSLMIGTSLISIGAGFMLPTIFVTQQSVGEQAEWQIFYLYAAYFLFATVIFVLIFFFMRAQPEQAPSLAAEVKKSTIKESIEILKKDKNLWKFFIAYILVYGTIVAFGSEANLLFKPYGFTDIQIGICAITMLVMGVSGSIAFSVYLKKTGDYKRALRAIVVFSFLIIAGLEIELSLSASLALTIVIIGFFGFLCTPIAMLCYDLGCQLAFPMGQAQVIGILNGGSLLFTFITTLIISSAVGFGKKSDTTIVMFVFLGLMLVGCFLFFKVKINLKRKDLESGRLQTLDESRVNDLVKYHHEHHEHIQNQQQFKTIQNDSLFTSKSVEIPTYQSTSVENQSQNYRKLIEEKQKN